MSGGMHSGSHRELSETFQLFLMGVARFLFWGGSLLALAAVGLLVYTAVTFMDGSAQNVVAATQNIETFRKILSVGLLATMVGSTYLFWGEEILAALQLIVAGLCYFSPALVPSLVGADSVSEVSGRALQAVQSGGTVFGLLAIGVLVADLANRVRLRVQQGIRVDQLKYGKGLKEEREKRNVFLGKCWQLPYCRKFVRESCPIYHSGRTCWREKVGCMCEEDVIRGAMENKAIPKDALAAARYIPQNNRLTLGAKKERCRHCVIYNEHQKHKYKAALGAVLVSYGVFYAMCRRPLLDAMGVLMAKLDQVLSFATYQSEGTYDSMLKGAALPFHELMLLCFVVVALAYSLKMVEYLIFKLKV